MRKQLWIQFAAALLMTALVLGIPAAWYFRPAGKWDEVKNVEGPFQWCRRGPFWYFCNDQGEPIVKDRWSNTKYEESHETLMFSYQGGDRIALCYGFLGDQKGKWGIVDLQGNVIVERRYDDIRIQQEFPGRAIFKKDGEYGIIDINGKILAENIYERINDYENCGLAVCCRDGKWGYLDTEGAEAIAPQFETASSMFKGRGAVMIDGLYGLIDETGKFILEPIYDFVDTFYLSDYCDVTLDGIRGWSDRDGNITFLTESDKSINFDQSGIAPYYDDGLWGYVDRQGNIIAQPEFEKAEAFGDEDYAIVRKDSKYGLLQKDGQYYFPPVCDYLEPYEKAYWTEDKKEYRLLIGDWMLLLNTVTDSLK